MLTKCEKCGYEFQISTKSLNKYGLVEGSKGDYISSLFDKIKSITFTEMMVKVDQKYPTNNNAGRVLRVINELKNKKVIYQKGLNFFLIK